MRQRNRSQSLLLVVALAMLSLRALTPEGYMPGSRDSGLLFELCPSGMPVEIMRALGGGHHHHHDHHGDGEKASVSGTEQCPIGHMLNAAAVTDGDPQVSLAPARYDYETAPARTLAIVGATAYRSRAPPA